MTRRPPRSTLFPYTPLSRSLEKRPRAARREQLARPPDLFIRGGQVSLPAEPGVHRHDRSEEHTSELQSRLHLVCRLLLEKKKKKQKRPAIRPTDATQHTVPR